MCCGVMSCNEECARTHWHMQAMLSELKETEDAMRPLRMDLQNVEEKIREYQAQINGVKVN